MQLTEDMLKQFVGGRFLMEGKFGYLIYGEPSNITFVNKYGDDMLLVEFATVLQRRIKGGKPDIEVGSFPAYITALKYHTAFGEPSRIRMVSEHLEITITLTAPDSGQMSLEEAKAFYEIL